MKEKLKTKSFWLSVCGSIIVLLQAFGLKIDVPLVNEIITALCSIAIVLGVMIDDTKKKEEALEEEKTEEISTKTNKILTKGEKENGN